MVYQTISKCNLSQCCISSFLDRSWEKLNGFRDGTNLHQLMTLDAYSGQSAVYMAILKGEEDSTSQGQYLQIEPTIVSS